MEADKTDSSVADVVQSTGIFWSDTTSLIYALNSVGADKWMIYLTVFLQIALKFGVLLLFFFGIRWWLKPSKTKEYEAQAKLVSLQLKKKEQEDVRND